MTYPLSQPLPSHAGQSWGPPDPPEGDGPEEDFDYLMSLFKDEPTEPEDVAPEARFRAIVDSAPYLGPWDEWASLAYDRIPVMARQTMAHLYGEHDDTALPYAHCYLCTFFRTNNNTIEPEDHGV